MTSRRSTTTNPGAPGAIEKYTKRRRCNMACGADAARGALAGTVKTGEDLAAADGKTNTGVTRAAPARIIFALSGRSVETRRPPKADKGAKTRLFAFRTTRCSAKNCSGSAKNGLS